MGNDIGSVRSFRSVQVNKAQSQEVTGSDDEQFRPTAPSPQFSSGFNRAAPPPPMELGEERGPPPFAEAAAEALGLTTDELDTQLRSGKSLTEVASAQGVSLDSLQSALAADFATRYPNATADQATQEADKIIAGPSAGGARGAHGHRGPPPFIEAAADAIGISSEELDAALKSGQTLEEVATNNGVSTDDLKTALIADLQNKRPDVTDDEAAAMAERLLTKTAPQPFRARDLQRAELAP